MKPPAVTARDSRLPMIERALFRIAALAPRRPRAVVLAVAGALLALAVLYVVVANVLLARKLRSIAAGAGALVHYESAHTLVPGEVHIDGLRPRLLIRAMLLEFWRSGGQRADLRWIMGGSDANIDVGGSALHARDNRARDRLSGSARRTGRRDSREGGAARSGG